MPRSSVPLSPFVAILWSSLLAACGTDKDKGGGPSGDDSDGTALVDLDGDGYGSPADCDDESSAISPGADERCNGLDDDCDGQIDEYGVIDGDTYHPDADGDGYGDADSAILACEQPEGMVVDGTDCDDSTAVALPGGVEVCDGFDNDCDGETDEEGVADGFQVHPDADHDGYGDPESSALVCALTDGVVLNGTDCDDGDGNVYPTAPEVCDDADNDCDGEVDVDATDLSTWYKDADRDGYGLSDLTEDACDKPSGYAAADGDCDDSTSRVNPGASEVCDGLDNNCDGVTDTDATDIGTWYADADGDGYGDPSVVEISCDADDGYIAKRGDCDDTDATIHPHAGDPVDGVDNDCDGTTDEGDAASYETFEGTFGLNVAVGDSDFCYLIWDTEGTPLDTCDDCLWAFDLEETYVSTSGSCGEGTEFTWAWGLVEDYYVGGAGYTPVAMFYADGYGEWYPGAYATWDEDTGETTWTWESYYDYSSYYIFYYTYYQEGTVGH